MTRFLAAIALTICAARADVPVSLTPYIVNASFEIPSTSCCSFPTGWFEGGSVTTTGDAGNWNPSSDPPADLTALSGVQVGYINNYSGANPAPGPSGSSVLGGSPEQNYWFLDQTLDIPGGMVAGTTYVLTYAVAIRADIPEPLDWRVQINGNYSPTGCDTCDAITSGSTASFVPGTWYYKTVDYTAQTADQGLQPTIYLVNDGATSGLPVLTQAEFDLPVPEPAGMIPLGLQFGSVALLSMALEKRLKRSQR